MRAGARNRGLALIVVIGILGVLAVLAVAFVAMAQLERRASQQRVNAARAYLLARSGVEDALARLELGQDPAYGGENWDGSPDRLLSAFEADQEVHHRTGAGTRADVESCPARHAMRPSFFAAAKPSPNPATHLVEGRRRGTSGRLAGDHVSDGNAYALKVQSANAGIHINGGALDDRDVSMEGPNGFLVRLLDNLDAVVTNGASAALGEEIVGARPVGGYKSLDELKLVLGQARFDRFKPYLTIHAWVDPKVVKPQPMDGRPQRWEDIDDAHRIGTEAREISGVHDDPTPFAMTVSGTGTITGGSDTYWTNPRLTLNPGITGNGKEAPPAAAAVPWTPLTTGSLGADGPWTQTITATNSYEGPKTYPVRWERNFVYAWSQLRLAPPALEPRAPLSLNAASPEALASVFLGLKGTYVEVWEGSAGWDAGFGWFSGTFGYPYPSQATEEAPWIRTRLDYGMTYGNSAFAASSGPWYGPADYDPHKAASTGGGVGTFSGGTPLILAAPLGRLRETPAITRAQAQAGARQIRQALGELGPARTWAQVNAFVTLLPRWEDVNEDGILDGAPYPVVGSGGAYTRRMYRREDMNPRGYGAGDFLMQRETFSPLPGTSWGARDIAWLDPHLPKAGLAAFGQVPGLTFVQKDVIKAMVNPNTDLNDFNPDGNLWKEVDKTDLAGIEPDPASFVHTTELSLDDSAGYAGIQAVGRVLGTGGRLLALRQAGALVRLGDLYRDTTQADFMRGTFTGPPAPYSLSGHQPLLSYPEPQTLSGNPAAHAHYDGQIALGFIGAEPMPHETLRGELFGTADAAASGDQAVPDLRGPFRNALLQPSGSGTGNVFPDGVYSEKDRALKFRMQDTVAQGDPFTVACWAKVTWYPEASPRAHALVSMSPSHADGWGPVTRDYVPVTEIFSHPEGLYFVPARNNAYQDQMSIYNHDPSGTQGRGWPCHSLLWGAVHTMWASDDLNRRGILELPAGTHPVGRLEAHRWVHLAMQGAYSQGGTTHLILGRKPSSKDGGGWQSFGFKAGNNYSYALSPTHRDGTENHLRFGEIASGHSMNCVADATFANVRAGRSGNPEAYRTAFTGPGGPAARGRYLKEDGAATTSSNLPAGVRPSRITWTEIPCDLWFDLNEDGWLGDPAVGAEVNDLGLTMAAVDVALGLTYVGANPAHGSLGAAANVGLSYSPLNDQFDGQGGGQAGSSNTTSLPAGIGGDRNAVRQTQGGIPGPNGLRDVHIALEVWDDSGRLARFDNPAADNRIPRPQGRLTYKAVFVNEWDAPTRLNHPLDVTPYLDDVSVTLLDPRILRWEEGE